MESLTAFDSRPYTSERDLVRPASIEFVIDSTTSGCLVLLFLATDVEPEVVISDMVRQLDRVV